METGSPTNELLKQKYNLHTAPEVQDAVERTEFRTGEDISQNPLDRIENYLQRFREITDREDPKARERGMDAIKRLLYKKNIIKPEDISESYWEQQRRIARERGQGADLEQVGWEEVKRQNTEAIISDQRSSLDSWIDYLSSPDAPYPDSFKYFALRSILQMGKYDKESKRFPQRFQGMTQPFPEKNSEALSYVFDSLIKKYGGSYFQIQDNIFQTQEKLRQISDYERNKQIVALADQQHNLSDGKSTRLVVIQDEEGNTRHIKTKDLEKMRARVQHTPLEKKEDVETRLQSLQTALQAELTKHNLPEVFHNSPQDENFAELYAWAIEKVTPASVEDLANTQGEWVKYNQGTDHMPLVQSLQGKGTGWCTAGEETAKIQLEGGDFYVFYSHDKDGKPTIPRVAIRMEEDDIAEVRGIAADQNLDAGVSEIVEEKLKEFPDGEAYKKKVADMKQLTNIEHKVQAGQNLTAAELTFLYEIDSTIEGFGYSRDPRIEELLQQRNIESDRQIIFPRTTEIQQKVVTAQPLTKDELLYLYEIDNPIPGLQKIGDPRVKELRAIRTTSYIREDISILFNYAKEQIASRLEEITDDTKIYAGPLEKAVFLRLPKDVEHIYLSFPRGEIKLECMKTITIGGKTKEQLMAELEQQQVVITNEAKDMLNSPDFATLPDPQNVSLIKLKVGDLDINRNGSATIEDIYARIQELGLELCPTEVGPHFRLQSINQPQKPVVYVGMKGINSYSYGRHDDTFLVSYSNSAAVLAHYPLTTTTIPKWEDDKEFLFMLPK